jgi:hypothetical protein
MAGRLAAVALSLSVFPCAASRKETPESKTPAAGPRPPTSWSSISAPIFTGTLLDLLWATSTAATAEAPGVLAKS